MKEYHCLCGYITLYSTSMKKHIKVGKPRCATTLEETIRKKVQHCPGCDKVYERVALLEEHILTCEKYRGVLRNVRISSSS